MSTPLLAGEHEQLSVDDEQLGDGVLEATASLDSRADSVDPLGGDRFDVLFTFNHKSECVERMSGPFGAMAAWLPATPMGEHQRAGESVWGNPDARQ
jgi:hypothetical protein